MLKDNIGNLTSGPYSVIIWMLLQDYISEKSQIITEYGRDVKFSMFSFNMVVL